MQKSLLLSLILACFIAVPRIQAQTTVLDFEAPATSTNFQYFGSSLDPQLTQVVANPNATGINTSANVTKYVKPADAQTWAGAFSNPDPATPIDAGNNNLLCVKIHTDQAESLTVKLENSTTGGSDWEQTQSTTTTGDWVELCYDLTLASEADANVFASGHIYPRVTIFFGLGTAGNGTDSAVYYLDDLTITNTDPTCNILYDFDSAATSTQFQYFGSSLEPQLTPIVGNPNPDTVNMSDSVLMYVKAAGSQVWAGAFSNPNPNPPVDFSNGGEICVDVHMTHIGSVTMKLEQSTTGGADWEYTLPNTVANAWETLCFNTDSGTVASGHAYGRVTFFIGLGTMGGATNDTTYLDNFCLITPDAPDSSDVSFAVDMNSYTGNFTQPYVSGNFNGWSGTANPLDDSDNDGIWTTTLRLPSGQIEYKFNYDDWTGQEEFNGTEKTGCTLKTGPFVNRVATISENTALDTVCYNSCYACGEAAMITINLGMGTVLPDTAGGVYLAGGAEFGAPGGRFQMFDDDGDGIYSITFERQKGFDGYYTFANGNCPDFSCKEDITGQSCADPNNFNDRFLNAVTQDTTLATCFEICSDNTSCTTGLNDLEFKKGLFTLAPSPARNYVELSFEQPGVHERQVRILNANGQVMDQFSLAHSLETRKLDIRTYSAGLYFVQVRMGNQFETQKVMKY